MANKGIAIVIEEFKLNLIKTINESGLSIPISKIVFGEVFSTLNEAYKAELEKENKEYEDAVNKENENAQA